MRRFVLFFSLLIVVLLGCRPAPEQENVTTAPGSTNLDGPQIPSSNAAKRLLDEISKSRGVGDAKLPPTPLDNTVDPNAVHDKSFPLKILSWNVESEGANSDVIAAQLQHLNLDDRYDVIVLTEVMPKDLAKFRSALGEHYRYAYTKSGFNDRIQILFNQNQFEEVRSMELKEINPGERYRAPLVVHLRSQSTQSNVEPGSPSEWMIMANHLARGKASVRQRQATMLVEWARDQTLPVIAVGDYNFDFVFETRKGNPAFDKMLKDNIWRWVEPTELIDTNWFDNPRSPDGADDYPGSMLDFAFVAGPAKEFKVECNVIVRDGDFPDDKTTSDHRPFELLIAK